MKYQKADLAKMPEQIQYVLDHYVRHNLSIDDFNNIVLCGLGGSGIAGRLVKVFFKDRCPVPIEVISDYSLPAFVSQTSLVILNSYSGNTEETLSMYMDAVEKKAKMLIITTGGLIGELGESNHIQTYFAEPGFQPRMALGYSLTYLVMIISELLKQNALNNLKSALKRFATPEPFIARAQKGFEELNRNTDKKYVIVCDPLTHPIGVRFGQQLQENAKAEAFVHELPEANHNVIESYYGKPDSVFLFIDSGSNQKISFRFGFLKELLTGLDVVVSQMDFGGYSIEEVYETIYVLDWLSLIIADARGVVSDQIPNINKLKNFLKDK